MSTATIYGYRIYCSNNRCWFGTQARQGIATPLGLTKRKGIGLLIFVLALGLVISFPLYSRTLNNSNPSRPLGLVAGDSWSYLVTYPDGETFTMTESVKGLTELNGTLAFLFLRDDPQHISTEYLWITPDWREIETFQPHIGNIGANVTVIYSPPLQLFQMPLSVGALWQVNSNMTTVTQAPNTRIQTVTQLVEEREVEDAEEISTPAGTFRCFKVTVNTNQSLSEILWFDPLLAQVVKGVYFNDQEAVTQILVTYSELPSSSSLLALFASKRPRVRTSSKLYLQQTLPSSRVENSL